eukprot:CAMPEP_0116872262 /NCGR_PEP_ID=MMETSP0463-20121206/2977_1 /TAXON_ID=181622 /ORGANISM="Strombidinopsis sp, Strain SopsisLIS2011" /LENGTH=187 /DNA_ID=CAMNT_0004512237 /DNA_START=88 /DNA_END=651 /DNA_ORIENTATION=+
MKSFQLSQEYQMLKSNPNFYHTLHEQIAIGFDEKLTDKDEKESGITDLRKSLISKHAQGIVLETCVGSSRNYEFYEMNKIKKLYGIDWVTHYIEKLNQRAAEDNVQSNMTVLNCDIHKTPFDDNSFDTLVDTFGLECSYDVVKAWAEMKRITKKGGKILLIERGQGYWMTDTFKVMQKASLNLAGRG